jgi:hypothetical protein
VVVDESQPRHNAPGVDAMNVVTNDGGPVEAAHAPSRPPDEWPYPLLFLPK